MDEFLMRLFVTRNIIFLISLVIVDTIFRFINTKTDDNLDENPDDGLDESENSLKIYGHSFWLWLFLIASAFHLVKFFFFKNHFQNTAITIGAAIHSGLAVTVVALVYSIFRKPKPLGWVIFIAAAINPLLVRLIEPFLFKLFF